MPMRYSRKYFGNSVTIVVPSLVMLIMVITARTEYSVLRVEWRVMMTTLASEAWPRGLTTDTGHVVTSVSCPSYLACLMWPPTGHSNCWHLLARGSSLGHTSLWHADAVLIGVISWPLKLSNEESSRYLPYNMYVKIYESSRWRWMGESWHKLRNKILLLCSWILFLPGSAAVQNSNWRENSIKMSD